MSGDQTYNGAANWATWNARLWATNEEAAYAWWIAMGSRYDTAEDLAIALCMELPSAVHNADMSDEDYAEVDWIELARDCIEDAQYERGAA